MIKLESLSPIMLADGTKTMLRKRWKQLLLLFAPAMVMGSSMSSAADTDLILAQNGVANYKLVSGSKINEVENFAINELKTYLEKITGAEFRIVDENSVPTGTKSIYVGHTEYASHAGVNYSELSEEEWIIKTTADSNLILSGGYPRGTIYAVYEFLEKYCGCRWLDEDFEAVPRSPNLSVPASLAEREVPSFSNRCFYYGTFRSKRDTERWQLFSVRNKFNRDGLPPRMGLYYLIGSPRDCHTFYAYTKDWPDDYQDLFSSTHNGQRLRAVTHIGPGQVCMKNPKVRELFAEKLRQYIKQDREQAVEQGRSFPTLYDISQNDNYDFCFCPECKEAVEKYGARSGLLIEFINAIADNIKQDYPEVFIRTFAYLQTEEPPRIEVAARDNVLVRLAFLGRDLYSRGKDTLRPVAHPNNEHVRHRVEKWGAIAANLSAWDYYVLYNDPFPSPYAYVSSIQADFEFYHRSNVKHLFIESEFPEATSFFELKRWTTLKLAQNPYQDSEKLIADFMRNYYGDAAGEMTGYLNYLETRMLECKGFLGQTDPRHRKYLDLEFFVRANEYLNKAEQLAMHNQDWLNHVRKEHIPVDYALLNMWNCLSSENDIPLDKKNIVQRLRKNLFDAIEKYNHQERSRSLSLASPLTLIKEFKDFENAKLEFLEDYPALPAMFSKIGKDDIFDMPWIHLRQRPGWATTIVTDKDAAGGRALKLGSDHPLSSKDGFHQLPLRLRLRSAGDDFHKNLNREDLFTDQKYHLYKVGTFDISPDAELAVHGSFCLQFKLKGAHNPEEKINRYDVYVSLKVQGPAYVPGSEDENAVLVDRVILARAKESKNSQESGIDIDTAGNIASISDKFDRPTAESLGKGWTALNGVWHTRFGKAYKPYEDIHSKKGPFLARYDGHALGGNGASSEIIAVEYFRIGRGNPLGGMALHIQEDGSHYAMRIRILQRHGKPGKIEIFRADPDGRGKLLGQIDSSAALQKQQYYVLLASTDNKGNLMMEVWTEDRKELLGRIAAKDTEPLKGGKAGIYEFQSAGGSTWRNFRIESHGEAAKNE